VAFAIEKSIIGTSHITINDQPETLSSNTKPAFYTAKKMSGRFYQASKVIIPMADKSSTASFEKWYIAIKPFWNIERFSCFSGGVFGYAVIRP
jgi:hypothetical protein